MHVGLVGCFDSGVGGLSVWREIARQFPDQATIYCADQAHIPYGPRAADEIRGFARGITRFLLEHGCDTIVVACNAASAAALATLRQEFPAIAFVGMEPAVKPAAEISHRRVAGVLATPATFQGALFATTVERFAANVRIIQQVCPGLVEQIEAGDVDGPETRRMLATFLRPSLEAGADTIVLACTHYPFVRDTIESLAGAGVRVIDPAAAIARQVGRVRGARVGEEAQAPAAQTPPRRAAAEAAGALDRAQHVFFTTGDPTRFDTVAQRLLGRAMQARRAVWRDGVLEALQA
jgi:glutamate racemase